jgi:hypothetical protein
LVLAGEVARGIAAEAEDPARMALFQMMPPGQLGIAWVLAVRAVRLSRRYRLFSLGITMAQWIGGSLFVLMIFLTFLSLPSFTGQAIYAGWVIWGVILVGVFIISIVLNNLQAPVLGVVCGLWGATCGTRMAVVWASAVGIYMAVLALIIAGSSLIWWAFVNLFSSYTYVMDELVMSLFGMLLLFFINIALHEIALRGMWAWVCRRMNATGREVVLV